MTVKAETNTAFLGASPMTLVSLAVGLPKTLATALPSVCNAIAVPALPDSTLPGGTASHANIACSGGCVGVGVLVGETVGTTVPVGVATGVSVFVGETVGTTVPVGVATGVGVLVAETVGTTVLVGVATGVGVRVGVGRGVTLYQIWYIVFPVPA